jgi:hypothetical protein
MNSMNENMKKYEALVKTLQETIQYNSPVHRKTARRSPRPDILTHTQCIEKLVAALLDQGIDALNKSKGVVDMMKLLKTSVKASGSKHNKWTYVIPQDFGNDPYTHEGASTLAYNLVRWLRTGFGEKHGFSAADYWQDKKMDLFELIGKKEMWITELLKAATSKQMALLLEKDSKAFDELKQIVFTVQPDFQFSWEKEEKVLKRKRN